MITPRHTILRRVGDTMRATARVGVTKFGVALWVTFGTKMGTGITVTPGHARLIATALLRFADDFESQAGVAEDSQWEGC